MRLNVVQYSILGLFCVTFAVGYDPATCIRCRETHVCNPPECFCCRDTMPLSGQHKIPQMVFFTFDDAVTPAVANHYRDLFDQSRKNPNGCPISMTLFVSHSNTVYSLVKEFYRKGMEIGSHSVTHSHPNSDTFIQEARAQKENLAKKADIPVEKISGWRSPFLEPLGDTQPSVLKELGYEYDATLTIIKKHATDAPITPFTLDYGWPYDCKIKPCPSKPHKGFWEVPVVSVKDYLNKYDCVYVDGCNNPPPSEETAFKFLWDNFQTYYTSNRAPFGINMHASWFFFEQRKAGMNRFIEELVKLDDVYIVNVKQVIEWLKRPTPLNQILNFQPWSCTSNNNTVVQHTKPVVRKPPTQRQVSKKTQESNRFARKREPQRQPRRRQHTQVQKVPEAMAPTRQPVSIPSQQLQQQSWQQNRMRPVPPLVPNIPMVRFWWRQSDMMMQRQMERRRNMQMQQRQQMLEQERRLAQERQTALRQQNMARQRQRKTELEMQRQNELERQRQLKEQRMRQQRLEQQQRDEMERKQQIEKQKQEDIKRQQQIEKQKLEDIKRQQQIEKQKQAEMLRRKQQLEQQKQQEMLRQKQLEKQKQEEIVRQQQIEQQKQEEMRRQELLELQRQKEVKKQQQLEKQKQQELERQQQIELQRQEELTRREMQNELLRQQQIGQQEQERLIKLETERKRQIQQQQQESRLLQVGQLTIKDVHRKQLPQNILVNDQGTGQTIQQVVNQNIGLDSIKKHAFINAQENEKRRIHEVAMVHQKEFEAQKTRKQLENSKHVTMQEMRLEELQRKQQTRLEQQQTVAVSQVTKAPKGEQLHRRTLEPVYQTVTETVTEPAAKYPTQTQTPKPLLNTTKESLNIAEILEESHAQRIERLASLSVQELQSLQVKLQLWLTEHKQSTLGTTTPEPTTTIQNLVEQFDKTSLHSSSDRNLDIYLKKGDTQRTKKLQQQIISNSDQYLGRILPPSEIQIATSPNKVVFSRELDNNNDIKISKVNIQESDSLIVPSTIPANEIQRAKFTTLQPQRPRDKPSNVVHTVPNIESTPTPTPSTPKRKVPVHKAMTTEKVKIASKPMWQMNSGDIEQLHVPWRSWVVPQTPAGITLFPTVSKSDNANINRSIGLHLKEAATITKTKPPMKISLFTADDFSKSIPIFPSSDSQKLFRSSTVIPIIRIPSSVSNSINRAFHLSNAPVAINANSMLPIQTVYSIKQSQQTPRLEQPITFNRRSNGNTIPKEQDIASRRDASVSPLLPNVTPTAKTLKTNDLPKQMSAIQNDGLSDKDENSSNNLIMPTVPSAFATKGSAQSMTSLIPSCKQGVNCFSPHCACKSASTPENMAVNDVPQIVYITIDGSLNFHSYSKINNLFSPRRLNPNGCRIKGTLFVTDAGSSYRIANTLHSDGIEIAISGLNTRPHRSTESMRKSIVQQKDRISRSSNIPSTEIKGWRSPGFKVLGDEQFRILSNYSSYDSSIVLDRSGKDHAKVWPYTLDFGVGEPCAVGECPSAAHPGVWEVPVIPFVGPDNSSNCEYTDGCTRQPASEQETLDYLMNNFNLHYKTNRAPFSIRLKQIWFHWYYRDNLSALLKFLDLILGYGDVYVTSIKDMLEYIERPLALKDISKFQPWKC